MTMKDKIIEIIERIRCYPFSDNSIDYAEKELLNELEWGWTWEVKNSLKRLEELYQFGTSFDTSLNGDTEKINKWDKEYDQLMDDICDRSQRWYRKYAEEMTDHKRPILPFDKWVIATDEERAILKESDRKLMERELRMRLISETLKVRVLGWEKSKQVTTMTGLREIQPYGMFHILLGDKHEEPEVGYENVYGFIEDVRPILWPISCLTEWVTVGGKKVCWLYEMKNHLFGPKKVENIIPENGSVCVQFFDNTCQFLDPRRISIEDVNFMYEHDIDCNGLIPKGLAMNALEEKVYE